MVLVTGAAGFIGSRLSARLARSGHEVTGLEALTVVANDDVRALRARALGSISGFTMREADIAEAPLESFVSGAEFVFHLAAIPGVRASWGNNFGDYARNNVLGTQRVLEACAAVPRGPRVVVASSSSLYGRPDVMPVAETATPRPRSPYGISKYAAELLAGAYAMDTGLDIVAARLFTVCGPGQRPDMAGSKLIAAAQGGPEFVVNGRDWTRDYTHVDDAVDALIALAQTPHLPQFAYNVSGGQRASIDDVARCVEEAVGAAPALRDGGVGRGDPEHTWADTTAIARDLGWVPTRTLGQAIAEQVADPDGRAALGTDPR